MSTEQEGIVHGSSSTWRVSLNFAHARTFPVCIPRQFCRRNFWGADSPCRSACAFMCSTAPTECPPHADRLHAHVVYALARTGNIERALKAFPGSDVSPGRRRRRSWRPSLPTSCCNKHFSTGQPRNGRNASLVAFSLLGTTRSRICQPHMPCWASAP